MNNDINAVASWALSMNRSLLQEQIAASIIRKNAQAERETADMIMENAKRIEELSRKSPGRIDLFV